MPAYTYNQPVRPSRVPEIVANQRSQDLQSRQLDLQALDSQRANQRADIEQQLQILGFNTNQKNLARKQEEEQALQEARIVKYGLSSVMGIPQEQRQQSFLALAQKLDPELLQEFPTGPAGQPMFDEGVAKRNIAIADAYEKSVGAEPVGQEKQPLVQNIVNAGDKQELEKKVKADQQAAVIDTQNVLSRLDRLEVLAVPEYFTYESALKAKYSRVKSKLGRDLSEEEMQNLQGRRKLVNAIDQEFNQYRKEITGAAAAIQELERLKESFLNSDLSYPEFQAAFGEYKTKAIKAAEIAQQLLREGIPLGSEEFTKRHDSMWKDSKKTKVGRFEVEEM